MSHVLANANISYQTIVKTFRACNILCSLASNFLKKSDPSFIYYYKNNNGELQQNGLEMIYFYRAAWNADTV